MSDHFCGLYRGTCVNNADPRGQDRIQVIVPQVAGLVPLADWALPCRPPSVDDTPADHAIAVSVASASHGTGSHSHPATAVITSNPDHARATRVPKVGQAVWVMFEGGDTDLPVWMGVS